MKPEKLIGSREIKFRVWKKTEMVFLNYVISLIKGTAKWVYRQPASLCFQSELQHCIDSDEFVVMQYTGLKDKNGKEIYEGDIIDCKEQEEGIPHRIALWRDEYACFQIGPWEKQELKGEVIEVIGNVFENPELLQNSKN